MDDMPMIPFLWMEATLLGSVALTLAAIHFWRIIRSELRPRKCVFCGDSIPAIEHEHHLETCGLRKLLTRDAEPAQRFDSSGRSEPSGQWAPKTTALERGADVALGPEITAISPAFGRDSEQVESILIRRFLRGRIMGFSAADMHSLTLDSAVCSVTVRVKTMDRTAVLCEAANCCEPAFYLFTATCPALQAAYCGLHAARFAERVRIIVPTKGHEAR